MGVRQYVLGESGREHTGLVGRAKSPSTDGRLQSLTPWGEKWRAMRLGLHPLDFHLSGSEGGTRAEGLLGSLCRGDWTSSYKAAVKDSGAGRDVAV